MNKEGGGGERFPPNLRTNREQHAPCCVCEKQGERDQEREGDHELERENHGSGRKKREKKKRRERRGPFTHTKLDLRES
jgi:hypothetical protein